MTEEERQMHAVMVVVNVSVMCLVFGLWQASVWAGVFLFTLVVAVAQMVLTTVCAGDVVEEESLTAKPGASACID